MNQYQAGFSSSVAKGGRSGRLAHPDNNFGDILEVRGKEGGKEKGKRKKEEKMERKEGREEAEEEKERRERGREPIDKMR